MTLKASAMSSVKIEIEESLAAILHQTTPRASGSRTLP
jgi:hypothetical protein